MTQGYCMKCKKKQEMSNTQNVLTKTGNSAVKGQCKKCNTNMYVILPKGGSKSKSKKSKSKKSKSKKSKSKKTKSKKSKK
jgi:hypothetical protein